MFSSKFKKQNAKLQIKIQNFINILKLKIVILIFDI